MAATHFEQREPRTRRATVLCIDDDPDISKALAVKLKLFGFDVIRAFDGMPGYWMALESRPDAIICDLAMPDGDGNYLHGRFRSHPLTKDVPVLILTAQANPAVKRQMLGLGVNAFLTKPVNFDELLRELNALIPE